MLVMLPSATVCLLVLALGWAAVEGHYVNGFDQDARLECPANQIFSVIGSIHSNHHEDRRWQFQCKPSPGSTNGCYWTSYLNGFDQPLLHHCPGDEVMNGMMSYHSNRHEDRRFMLQCCRLSSMTTRNCYYTGFVNEWDGEMRFNVPNGQAIKGVYSVHDNKKEDRRWKFYLCYVD